MFPRLAFVRAAGVRCALLLFVALALVVRASAQPPPAAGTTAEDVTKATLPNGLRVVIVRNTIAPVVSTVVAYQVGSRDDPPGVPGMAHAQEHMMFRGTPDLSTAQLGTIATALGGEFNAQTTETLTEYQFTVPSTDLDAVLRIESDRMRDVLDLQSQWQDERGAIEQEVARDESQPGSDFFDEAQAIAFKGSGYQHPGVGTKAAFDRLTGPELKVFWKRWYAPNNAVLVIAGDVDPQRALAEVRARFAGVPHKAVPVQPVAHLAPIPRTVIRRGTTLAFPLAAVGFRMPGLDDPDFIASFVLQGILGSDRGALAQLAQQGQVLDCEWSAMPYVPEGQLGLAVAALRPGDDPIAEEARLEAILTDYAKHGVPAELFEATRRRLITDQEESRNSVSSLASDWADTIANDHEPSIAAEQQLIAHVTLADVDRVARRYLDPAHAIVGELTPSANARPSTSAPGPTEIGRENNPLPVQPVVQLPAWAQPLVANVSLPPSRLDPVETKLPNGIRLIVQPETISNSVFVFGEVKSDPALEEPLGREGVAEIMSAMFPYGTATLDRAAFLRAQDDLDAEVGGGPDFGLEAPLENFAPAVQLLAQNELQPRFDADTLDVARGRAIDQLETELNSTHSIALREAAAKLYPLGDPALRRPTVAGLQGMSLADVQSYYRTTMRPDLTTIVVVGNVTPQRAQSVIEAAFGSWRATGPPPTLDLPPIARSDPGSVRIHLPPSITQDYVTLEQVFPLDRSSPYFYPLVLGNAILGGGSGGPEQSRLYRDIRQNAGLVYSIDSEFGASQGRSRFAIEFACAPANEPRIESEITAELDRLRQQPVGDFELELMKASMVRRVLLDEGSAGAVGRSLLSDAVAGRPLDQDRVDARALLGTSAAAIQAAFAAAIEPQDFVRVLEGP